MTPPPVDAAVLQRSARQALRRSRLPRPAVTPRTDWSCENCDHRNDGRRRRCSDCGTSRY